MSVQRETWPFITMASQPLLNLTSSHSPLNTHTHSRSTSTWSLTPPLASCTTCTKQRKRNNIIRAAEQNYKTCKCLFCGMTPVRERNAGGQVDLFLRSLNQCLEKRSLDHHKHTGAPCSTESQGGRPTPLTRPTVVPERLVVPSVGGQGRFALVTLQTGHDTRLLDEQEISFTSSSHVQLRLFSGREAELVGLRV